MEEIYKFVSASGRSITVLNPETVPKITFVVRVDAPGERAVSCSVPEDFFANVLNAIHLPGASVEHRQLEDFDSGSGTDQQA